MSEASGDYPGDERPMDDPDHVPPIQVNAGGVVSPEDLVGRQAEIDELFRRAAPPSNGAILLGDRRIGKTSLLVTLEGPLREAGHLVVRVSAETSSLEEFSRRLLEGLRENRLGRKWEFELAGEAAVNVGVAKFGFTGKAHSAAPVVEMDLFTFCAQAAGGLGGQKRVVFLLDEITVLAAELAKDDPDGASDFMHTLRRARQELPEVVMFLAGSIGLHHALSDGAVVNDLGEIHVETLSDTDAMRLALGLIAGADLRVSDTRAVAETMVAETSGFPYYLHGVTELLSQSAEMVTPETVKSEFQRALDQDLWDSSHYETRLDEYFGSDAELVRDILDAVATAEEPLSVTALMEQSRVAAHRPQRTHVLSLLRRMEADHYLRRCADSSSMANDLIKRIWLHVRRL